MSIHKLLRVASFPKQHYFSTMQRKTQIVLHHTAGGSAMSAINWWKTRNDGKGTVATPYVIERNGDIYQLFNAFQWAHHLGVAGKSNLDKQSIGIELVCFGALQLQNAQGKEIIDYGIQGYRGSRYFEKYTNAQMESLSLLLPILSTFAGIPIKKAPYKNLFEVSADALAGKPGLYTHAAYRPDKSDCHPQPELVEMLASL